MIQIEKHGIVHPFWRCTCPKCGCEFTFDDEDVTVFGLNSSNEILKVICCPECSYHIDETHWDNN